VVILNWKKLIKDGRLLIEKKDIKVGLKVRLRKDSDKSDWGFDPDVEGESHIVFKIKRIGIDKKILIGDTNTNASNWEMSNNFLMEHFERVI